MFARNSVFLKKKTLLLAAAMLPVAVASVPADAARLHSDVSLLTYTDFGQNLGRYAVGNTNALLDYLNKDGVKITYTGGQADYTLEHGMIDFSSQCDGGYGAAIGYNFYATVQHNGVHNNTYTGNYIGESNAIHYQGIEYRASGTFLLTPSNDYKITRQSKLITDVTGSTVYGSVDGDYSAVADGSLAGELLYRAGSGRMSIYNHDGSSVVLTGAYKYITGGVMEIHHTTVTGGDGAFSSFTYIDYTADGINDKAPLPFAGLQGDSGSPTWVWNEKTQQYEYLNAAQSVSPTMTQSRGDVEWTAETMASYDKNVAIGTDGVVYLNGTATTDTTYSDSANGVSTTLWKGTVTDSSGNALTDFVGVKAGTHTWKDLGAVKDTNNWYSYGDAYLNANSSGSGKDLSYADLFMTENLVFKANAATGTQQIILNADVDLGIGYVQFSKADGADSAKFTVSSADGKSHLLNSAGYVVDKGVEVHLQLTNSADYLREWRKIGDGDLYIEGSGDNYALLNLGGDGTTYLHRENGYAAYNVLANNGTTVVIRDIGQIYRDFTFGFRGGLLDMNGNSMTWNNGNDASAEGFAIHALDEGAVVANRKAGTTTTLTWTQSGAQTWLGSFTDTKDAALKFIYDGGENSSLTMHGIYTNLQNESSGIEVKSGTLVLVGTNTVHGMGSATGTNANRYSSALDWHYADAAANVEVKSGATFELGSHARLTGDVSVADGGTFVMREGVQHRYEYIEGGYVLEDTNAIAEFFGLKGDVALNGENANLKIEFGDDVSADLAYAGNITGGGNVSVALGAHGASLTLSGNNTFTGTKTLTSGGLVATSSAALGDVSRNKWLVGEAGWLAVKGDSQYSSTDILGIIDASSTGVLALTSDRAEQIDLVSSHSGVILGAAEGMVVRYGAAGTTETLNAVNGKWVLGGGGGELVVNFRLTGSSDLILGNAYGKGVVTLANALNDFTGTISFVGGVTLNYTDAAALGKAKIDLSYTNRAGLTGAAFSNLPTGADGVLLLDSWTTETLDLSAEGLRDLAVGANGDTEFDGKIAVAENAAYRFGGTTGTLTLSQALSANGVNDLVLDAQTYSGGAIVLAQKAEITGTVSLKAFDAEKLGAAAAATAGGDITLSFSAGNDDALASASATKVLSGGVIDLDGTKQTLKNLTVESGGSVIDSANAGTLALTGENQFSGDGNVSVRTLSLLDGATLSAAHANAFANIGKFVVEAGETGTLSTALSSVAAGGEISVAETGTLRKNGAGTLVFSSDSISIANLSVAEGTLQIRNATTASGSGKTLTRVELGAGATLSQYSAQYSAETPNAATAVGELSLNGDATLQETNFGGHWKVGTLTLGEGVSSATLTLDANHSADNFSIFEFGGADSDAGNFAGTLLLTQTNETDKNRAAAVILSGANVAKNAVVSFGEQKSTAVLALGVHADDVKIAGLSGSKANSALFSGTIASGQRQLNASGGAVTAFQTSWIKDGAARTLTIDTAAGTEYAFAGTVVADAAGGSSLSLVKTGAGTQKFTGSSISVGDVSALAGTLAIDSAAAVIAGDVAVARGATLTLGGGFSLDEGKTFTVLGAEETAAALSSASANFTGTLTLNGGELVFSGAALSAGSTALALGGLSVSETLTSQVIRFTDGYAIDVGVKYQLSDQDWSGVGSITAESVSSYLTTSVEASSSGLFVTFTKKDAVNIWSGTAESNRWSSSVFGTDSADLPASGSTVYFSDRGYPVVSVSENVSAKALVFESSQDYSVSSAGGDGAAAATITAEELRLVGAGTTTISSGVSITGTTTIESGELVVKSADLSLGKISGAGTLAVDWSGSGTLSGLGEIGSLRVIGGRFDASETLTVTSGTIRVGAGGQFFANADQTANFELSGAGWSGGDSGSDAAATLRIGGGATLSGSVSLTGDTAVFVAEGESGTISGAIDTGTHALTKTGAGTLTVSGAVGSGASVVASGAGTTIFSGEVSGKISVRSGTANFTGTLSDASLSVAQGAQTTLAAGTLSSLGGSGEVFVGGAGEFDIADMRGFSGKITKTGTGALVVGTVSDSAAWKFVGASLGEGFDFNNFAGTNATVELVGAAGSSSKNYSYIASGADRTFSQNFILTSDAENGRDYGLSLNAGSSSAVHTFTGSFSGNGKLVLSGKTTERTVLAGDLSNFSGGFSVSDGRILEFSDNGGTTKYADETHVIGTGTITNTSKIVFNYGADHTIGNAISGTFEKTGAGTLTLTGSVGGTVSVGAGTLALTNAQLSGTVAVSGGVLDLTRNSRPEEGGGKGSLTVSNGGVVKLAGCEYGKGANLGTKYNYSSTTLKNGGVFEVTQGQTTERSFNVAAGTGVYRFSGTGTHTLNRRTGESDAQFIIALAAGTTLRFDVVEKDATLTVNKTIGASGTTAKLEKTGAGTLSLSGIGNYSGGTTISEGKLVAASANALGSGGIRIDGGQLEIAGGVTLTQTAITIVLNESSAAGTSAAKSGSGALAVATLAVGETADAGTPTPAIVGTGTLADDTKITLELSETQKNEIANLAAGSALRYYLWAPDTVSVGNNVFAADGSGFTLSGDGWNGNGVALSYADGVLTVTAFAAIPEPSAFGLLAGTAALALALSARRRKKTRA